MKATLGRWIDAIASIVIAIALLCASSALLIAPVMQLPTRTVLAIPLLLATPYFMVIAASCVLEAKKGGIDQWWEDSARKFALGELTGEEAREWLDEASRVIDANEADAFQLSCVDFANGGGPIAERASWSLSCTPKRYLVSMAFSLACVFACCACAASPLVGICSATTAIAAICDIERRILPWQLCVASGIAGLAWQGASFGLASMASALLLAIALSLANVLINKVCPNAIGWGDIRLAFSCSAACGLAGCIPGLLMSSVVTIACVIARAIRGVPIMGTQMPMGPVFLAWIVSGMAYCAI